MPFFREHLINSSYPLLLEEHINHVADRDSATYTVMVGQTSGSSSNVVFYYDAKLDRVGWSLMGDSVKDFSHEFPVAADFSILSPDKKFIAKLGLNHKNNENIGQIVALADCSGGPMMAPCFVVLRRKSEFNFFLHLYNAKDNSYFQGMYDMSLEAGMIEFMTKVEKERLISNKLGLPPIRVWLNGRWITKCEKRE